MDAEPGAESDRGALREADAEVAGMQPCDIGGTRVRTRWRVRSVFDPRLRARSSQSTAW
jgi:hypothetical protein